MSHPTHIGLTATEAARRLDEYGRNEIAQSERVSWLKVLLRQFTGLMILILFAAALVALILGEEIDALAIGLVLLLNGVLGFVQEWRTENALAALRAMLTTHTRVIRDGVPLVIDTAEVVPGDLVVLESGDKVPADLDLSTAQQLRVDESILSGESVPVDKDISGASSVLYMGTNVVAGRAEGIVNATGAATEFGQIAELTGRVGEEGSHLQRQLGRLARGIGIMAALIAVGVTLVGVLVGRDMLEMFMTGIALAVAMVPEGLPAVVTITLALGATAMLRQQALVRRMQAIEALGVTSVICTDKTGTLTENAMTATHVWIGGKTYDVSGTGYDPAGHIACDGARCRAEGDAALAALLDVGLSCTHAGLSHDEGGWHMVGDPTEGALVVLGYKGWAPLPGPGDILAETPFSSERKRMSVLVRRGDALMAMAKGAPEAILEICDSWHGPAGMTPLDAQARGQIEAAVAEEAAKGRRVLALAQRQAAGRSTTEPPDEAGFAFLGLVSLIDPPRAEVRDAIRLCHDAGIRVVMITGDSPLTAKAIADEIGLDEGDFLTGADLEDMDDDALRAALATTVHFARTRPAHKLRIVQALQELGHLAAMTGDGVNDAPALKQADIGVAMGQRGTDVAKDASDLVLLDDNFATIVRAVREGRRQFSNIRKFVRYLLASNTGEVVAILATIVLGWPLIFLATQILWMNLITDGVTAVALGLEKAEPSQMRRGVQRKDSPIVDRSGVALIACFGLYTGLASLWLFHQTLPMGEDLARTLAFTGMVVFEKVSVFAFRSLHAPCWRIGWFSNRLLLIALTSMLLLQVAAVYWTPLQLLLSTVPLALDHWLTIGLLALPLIVVPELVKTGMDLRRS